MKISFCTYSSNTDGWRVFGCRPLYAVFACTQLLSRTPGTLNWTAFRKIDGLLQKTLATDAHPQITALLNKKNGLFFHSWVRWSGLLAARPFGESGHPTARLDLCVLSSFAACTRGGLASLAELARLLLEPPPFLTTWPAAAWTVDLVSVRFSRPQLLHQWQSAYLAAQKKKKKTSRPLDLTCLTTLRAGQMFDVTSVNQTQISSSLTETN